VAVLLVAAAPLLSVTFGTPNGTVLRTGASSRVVSEALATNFTGDTTNTIDVITTAPVDSPSAVAKQVVNEIRARPGPSGTTTQVGGDTADLMDTMHSIESRLPFALLIVFVATFILLFLFTGSVVQPLRAFFVNGLSLSAALGVMTWIFQEGHLTNLLDVTAQPMDTAMPGLAETLVSSAHYLDRVGRCPS
jgi:RND superfamily putative drug exporter